jgi:diguanylate cyclase (GGDEF)-like protein/PAS domain S-box-containing protein
LFNYLVADKIDRYQLEKRYIRKNGSTVWVNLVVTKYVGQKGELDYFVSIIKDIQDRKEAEESLVALQVSLEVRVLARTHDLQEANEKLSFAMAQQLQSELALRKREAELSMVIENANDAYVCMDQAGVIIEWNHQAEQTFGWSASEAIGCALDELIIPPEMREAHRAGMKRYHASGEHKVLNQRLELMALRRDGSVLPTEVRVRALHLEGHVIFSAFLHDITERKQAELKREHEAGHDALTGLPNRRTLFELIPHAIARANRQRIPLAIVFLDLDGFKAVNDTQGHEAGDAVLCAVAQRLRESVRDTDTVVRLAGDEFTLILEFLSGGVQDARLLAEKLLLRIQEPILIGKNTAHVSASIGITLYLPGSETTPNQLVSTADAAMYEAKRAGKSRVCVQ